ncbi:TonB-dependent receptor [Filimonas effusa]|uniref:TonB-dependent receptor n=1 Tax=Filimonas effusa TaxID=2508721 RepID=A0A4Q1D8I5_9BACT|nr:TonB-dependent receptor [Filimonas effusa]RXK85654.1 TonB-dependent receptor [Filimonas effusa]
MSQPVAYLLLLALFAFSNARNAFAQTGKRPLVITGQVVDKNQKPIEFATVRVEETEYSTSTDTSGKFSFSFYENPTALTIQVSFVGKKTIIQSFSANQLTRPLTLQMKDLSLTLDEVQVTGLRRGEASNSSVLFNREAIEQAQAFSLADILNNLPGKTTVAPNLQSPQNITLRSEASDAHALNNAMGIAIVMDGTRISNDANMQNTNVGKNGMANSRISGKYGMSDVTFGGIDLREIPADNIESIEVVQGVASAQYGELTDGAIIINRQAGKTNYQFSTRVNAESFNMSLSKGYTLSKKAGALNVSLNYLNSNADPSDNLKSYSRVSTELMWTNFLAKGVKHTLSLGYNTRLDNGKADPDAGDERSMFAKSRTFRISERLSMQFNRKWLTSGQLSFSYSRGYQETYSQWWLNGAVKPMTIKDTTGIYEGYYIPGSYYAVEHIKGEPINLSGTLSFNSKFNTGEILHALSWGTNISLAANKGKGIIADPNNPRWPNLSSKNDRPYEYNTVPEVPVYGLYLQDNFKLSLLGRIFYTTAGLRYDLQNGWGNIQPRINTRYKLNNRWELNIAYGISRKAPAMSHRYPGPTFYDILLLNEYTGDTRTSLALFYTEKYTPDNSHLRPAASSQLEGGIRFNGKSISSALFLYYKNNTNGFTGVTHYRPFSTPVYKTIANGPGQKPTYYATSEIKKRGGLYESRIENVLTSQNYGADWTVSIRKIRAIQTSFDINTSCSYSRSFTDAPQIRSASDNDIALGKKAWYALYHPQKRENLSVMSKLNSITHIPKLGFVVNISADFFWAKRNFSDGIIQYPYAYLDQDLAYHEIKTFEPSNPDYGHLATLDLNASDASQPFIYGNLSLRISKEIKKNMRFSVNAYNVFNLRPKYEGFINGSYTSVIYNAPVSLGAEFSIKF